MRGSAVHVQPIARDSGRRRTTEPRIGLVVALSDELGVISRFFERPEGASTIHGPSGREYSVLIHPDRPDVPIVCALTGGMGLLQAAQAANDLLTEFDLELIVLTGIAGALHPDVHLGDVVIPKEVRHYLWRAKALNMGKTAVTFEFAGQSFTLKFGIADALNKAQSRMVVDGEWDALLPEFAGMTGLNKAIIKLRRSRDVRPKVHLFEQIASGDVVCASENLAKLLRTGASRTASAIEMEAAGVASVADAHAVQWLVVRGISDYSDGRKSEIDGARTAEGEGPWRTVAVENCGRVLFRLLPDAIDSIIFGPGGTSATREPSTNGEPPQQSKVSPQLPQVLEDLFVHIGERGLAVAAQGDVVLNVVRTGPQTFALSAGVVGDDPDPVGFLTRDLIVWEGDARRGVRAQTERHLTRLAGLAEDSRARLKSVAEDGPVGFIAFMLEDGSMVTPQGLLPKRPDILVPLAGVTSEISIGKLRAIAQASLPLSEGSAPDSLMRALESAVFLRETCLDLARGEAAA